MKNLFVFFLVIVAGRSVLGCSDDGVYTPVEAPIDAGTDAVQACEFVDETLCAKDG